MSLFELTSEKADTLFKQDDVYLLSLESKRSLIEEKEHLLHALYNQNSKDVALIRPVDTEQQFQFDIFQERKWPAWNRDRREAQRCSPHKSPERRGQSETSYFSTRIFQVWRYGVSGFLFPYTNSSAGDVSWIAR